MADDEQPRQLIARGCHAVEASDGTAWRTFLVEVAGIALEETNVQDAETIHLLKNARDWHSLQEHHQLALVEKAHQWAGEIGAKEAAITRLVEDGDIDVSGLSLEKGRQRQARLALCYCVILNDPHCSATGVLSAAWAALDLDFVNLIEPVLADFEDWVG